jgi:hypothetical protein
LQPMDHSWKCVYPCLLCLQFESMKK